MPLRGGDVVRIMEGFVGVDVVMVADCRKTCRPYYPWCEGR